MWVVMCFDLSHVLFVTSVSSVLSVYDVTVCLLLFDYLCSHSTLNWDCTPS